MPSRATKADHVGMGLYEVAVRSVRQLSPHLRRVTLASEQLRDFRDDGPDQRFKLLLPRPGQDRPLLPDADDSWYRSWQQMDADQRPVLRTYTVREARPEAGELDVDMLVHDDGGPGSAWAAAAEPGTRAAVYGAFAEYDADPAALHLVAGDHAALPAVAAILERMDPGVHGTALLEVPGPDERLSLSAPQGVEVVWLDVSDRGPGAALVDEVRARTGRDLPDYAWVAADQETAAVVRRHLVSACGMRPEQVMFMGYWRTDGAIDDA